jgi:VWFA-related protein
MKKVFASMMVVGLMALGIAAQNSQTVRPRVAPTATPMIQNDPQAPTDRKPPVLNGQNNSKPTDPAANDAKKGEDDGVYRIDTNLVTMPVSVLDKDGRFISGLTQKDFKVFENGQEQKVEYFQSVEQPFTVILMIDVSPSTQWQIEDIQNAALTFVNQLRPSDKVMVIAFDERTHVLSPVTTDRYVLKSAIMRSEFGDGTSLYEAVDHVLNQELSQIQGRKAVVLFTDGVDTTSRTATYESTIQDTQEADALFYTIRFDTSRDMNAGVMGGGSIPGPGRRGGNGSLSDILNTIILGGGYPGPVYGRRRPAGSSPEEYATGKKYLETLAQESGGREFESDTMTNVSTAFAGVAEELRRQYSLGYYPDKIGQVGDRKQISIRVDRPNVVVRAKNYYIVGQTDRQLAGK